VIYSITECDVLAAAGVEYTETGLDRIYEMAVLSHGDSSHGSWASHYISGLLKEVDIL
jgi:hypothetical protein